MKSCNTIGREFKYDLIRECKVLVTNIRKYYYKFLNILFKYFYRYCFLFPASYEYIRYARKRVTWEGDLPGG